MAAFLEKPPELSTKLESLVYNFIYLIQNNIFSEHYLQNRTQLPENPRKKTENVNCVNQNFRAVGLKYTALEPPLYRLRSRRTQKFGR